MHSKIKKSHTAVSMLNIATLLILSLYYFTQIESQAFIAPKRLITAATKVSLPETGGKNIFFLVDIHATLTSFWL